MRTTEGQRRAILHEYKRLVEGGLTRRQAARQVGVHYISLLRWQQALGIQVQAWFKTDEEKKDLAEEFARLVAGGMKTRAAAKKMGLRYQSLLNWSREFGIDIRRARSGAAVEKAVGIEFLRGGGIALTTTDGYRIEGLTMEELGQVLESII